MLSLIEPDFTAPDWECLPGDVRTEIRGFIRLFKDAPQRGVTKWLREQAAALSEQGEKISYATLRLKYDALRNNGGDWKELIDKRKVADLRASKSAARSLVFAVELTKMVEQHQRKHAPAFAALRRRWKERKHPIPGYEDWTGWPNIPAGWTDANLYRIVQQETDRAKLASIRIGTSSKTNPFLPTVHTTRVGLWPGAVIQIDDVWHDNYVTLGKKREVVRVLELGALDLFSASRFHWGAKPRRRTATGSWETIRGTDMRMFLAGLFHRFGYCPSGTMIMSEHATAKVDEDIARSLYDATRGLIRVEYQPIEGKQAALAGYWGGTEGGNFRAKALLESTHNPIHNALAALPGQLGSPTSGIKGPVTTDRIATYIQKIVADVLKKVPHRLELLRLPLLDFHTQFLPFLTDYYEFGLDSRTDHDLEGWSKLEHIVTDYTLVPGSEQWLSEQEFLALPDASRIALGEAIRHEPKRWTKRRNLSPKEVWNKRQRFNPLPPTVFCDILGRDLAREVKADRGFLTFKDQEIAADPLIYKARYVSGPNVGREIPHGEKISMFVLPFDDRTAIVCDAKDRFLGEVELYKRVCPINPHAFGSAAPFEQAPQIHSEEFHAAAAEKHSRIADIVEPLRIRHAEQVQDARDLRAHNKRVADPNAAVTPEEKAAAREQQQDVRLGRAINATRKPSPKKPEAKKKQSW